MAGRPKTMARRVQRLFERQAAIADELDALMPEWYRPPDPSRWNLEAKDAGGNVLTQAWRTAVFNIGWASSYLEDLSIFLDLKVKEIEKRTAANEAIELDDLDDPDDDQPVTAQEAATETESQNAAQPTPDADAEKLSS